MFAEATGDQQWIHVDPERAKDSPFGSTIAHGFLTLSLIPLLMRDIYRMDITMGVNYGLNKVRFISPVKVGARVRGVAEVLAVDEIDGGAQATWRVTIE